MCADEHRLGTDADNVLVDGKLAIILDGARVGEGMFSPPDYDCRVIRVDVVFAIMNSSKRGVRLVNNFKIFSFFSNKIGGSYLPI